MEEITTEAFVLTVEERTVSGRSQIHTYAHSIEGPVKIISDFCPYFYISASESLPSNVNGVLEHDPLRSLSGISVKKISFRSVADADAARLILQNRGVQLFESDVKPRDRFLMDLEIFGGVRVSGQSRLENGIRTFINPQLDGARVSPAFVVCSLDIETSMSNGDILSIAAHNSGGSGESTVVFMRDPESVKDRQDYRAVPDERSLLKEFERWFQVADPDIIIGWNVVGFDLNFLQKRAAILRVSCNLGREQRSFYISENTGRFSQAYIPGRVTLDGPQLLRNSFHSFESYSLENVSQKVLGEGKLLSSSSRGHEIEKLFTEDKSALAAYNLKDTVLVTRILEKLGLLELTKRRSELSGMLLNQVGLSVASFDHCYLPRLHRQNFVSADVGQQSDTTPSAGGYVISPTAGLYDNVISLDFRSLYPSIIRTFGIDPLALAAAELDRELVTTPKGFVFSRERSILPAFIGELLSARSEAKRTGDQYLSQAIKILMNSFYGVMGSPGSRLFHPRLPDAITSTGQWLLTESVKWIELAGHKVIYGDTDSLFVQQAAVQTTGARLAESLTHYWDHRLKNEFSVTSYLAVEFKKDYQKFLVPNSRNSEGGAKKRYAGYSVRNGVEEVEFIGFEVVRSDWTTLAREFQRELYTKVFRGDSVEDWVRDFVQRLNCGYLNDQLVYRKKLHKRLDDYGDSPPPYVRAARQMKKPGREIRYVITTTGPVPADLNASNFDYTHYVDKQLRPVADSILEVLGTSFAKIMSRQISLF